MESKSNNNNNTQQSIEENNDGNQNENNSNLSNQTFFYDFFYIPDPADQMVSTSEFEESINDENQITNDFDWLVLNNHVTNEWRSTPIQQQRHDTQPQLANCEYSVDDLSTNSESMNIIDFNDQDTNNNDNEENKSKE
ncbi:hypothetical protein DERP_014776 [Dermatophagoides pteronyssinus]|uniref:Uncharacterized protein n=1 Tax=Dermatophagoides pteronyssinus TaxID=6956 RepID=A0ABQ8J2I4_DERPT|nr:hypothetical protein DERP_014776 [Dermatophagoides pteronyssinus]